MAILYDANIMEKIRESAAYIRARIKDVPDIAVVLGSGLGGFADHLSGVSVVPYDEIPHFPRLPAGVTAPPGHNRRLVAGAISAGGAVGGTADDRAEGGTTPTDAASADAAAKLPGGARVLCMQGRFHLYEGYSMADATWHIRVMKELGVSRVILTNASGGMVPEWRAGDLMLITDHINYMGRNPLTGPNLAEYGPRFPDMTHVYDPAMMETARKAAAELPVSLREGVYVGFCGPSYETPAEIRMFRALGASAVGMSTVPEAIVANHCGIKVCGISCITNLAAGILDQPLTEAEVVETAAKTGPVFEALLRGIINRTRGRDCLP